MRGSGRLRLLLVLLVLTAFTLTALDFRSGGTPFDAVRRGSDVVFGPAQRAVGGAARSVGNALGGLPRLGTYKEDNARLTAENDRLRARLRETEGLRAEQRQWNRLLAIKDAGDYTVVPAHISTIGSSFGFEWTATIDVGSEDGIKVDQTVLSGEGLVGRTKRVGRYTSVVLLIADPGFTVGARLQRTRSFGFVTGRALDPLSFTLVGKTRVAKGDVLVTSGSGTFVPGVPIGQVLTGQSSGSGLTQTYDISPYVDVTALDLVGVVVEPPRRTPRLPLKPAA
ncbi:MAG: rod shape-determining protein MreC [Actinobacteria bacterium]|nr:rod shape-determining protein MreC [Actinomycetota bacterium]MCA1720290.1 rod shape-determining protein MreC [Actinomycetota bacterium]